MTTQAEREALQECLNILGPFAPSCSGCSAEIGEALRVIKAALASAPAQAGPSYAQLVEMAYLLRLVPRGEAVAVQLLEVLQEQFKAAMAVATQSPPPAAPVPQVLPAEIDTTSFGRDMVDLAKQYAGNKIHAYKFAIEAENRLLAALQGATALSSQPPAPSLPPEILAIAERLHTQDNRITQDPLFAVQQKRRIWGVDPEYCDNSEWVLDGESITLEEGEDAPEGARKVGYFDKWEFVTGCLTEQGCKDFIACNGHNLHKPRIYAYGSYRNAELIALRKWLMSLPLPSAPSTEGAAG